MNTFYDWTDLDPRYFDWPALLLVIGIFAVGLTFLIIQDARRRRITKQVKIEPHPLRPLQHSETQFFMERLGRYNRQFLLSTAVLLFSVAALTIFIFIDNAEIGVYFVFSTAISAAYVIDAVQHLRRLKKDLKNHVFQVRGKVFKDREITKYAMDPGFYVSVGNIRFHFRTPHYVIRKKTGENYPLYEFYQSVKNGDEVEVLYSPATKHIWSIKKVS